MVARKRLNLSISPIDFDRLLDAAESEGKLPSTYAADLLRVALSKIPRVWRAPRAPTQSVELVCATPVPIRVESQPVEVVAPLRTSNQRKHDRKLEAKKRKR